jgi:hypothetical protein
VSPCEDTHGERGHDDRGRGWNGVAITKGMPRIAVTTRDQEKGMEQILLGAFRGM